MRKKSASIRRRLTASLLAASIALSCLIAGGCDRESETNHSNARGRMVIQNIGSDTMVNLAQAWAEEYATVEPAASVEVSGGGTGTGVAALINGTADIANCSRQMEAGEIAKVRAEGGQEPKLNIVGYDALAIFAHKENPLDEITIERLAAIYGEKGPVRSWADLGVQIPGCQSGEMILVSRQSNSGTYHYFRSSLR
jgi:phosphate transport system substrate-binding protein